MTAFQRRASLNFKTQYGLGSLSEKQAAHIYHVIGAWTGIQQNGDQVA